MSRRRGIVLPLVLVTLTLAFALVFIRGIVGDSDFRRARTLVWHNQATFVAEGGLELALSARQAEDSTAWVFRIGGNDVSVVELDADGYIGELRATAKVGEVTVVRTLLLRPAGAPRGMP